MNGHFTFFNVQFTFISHFSGNKLSDLRFCEMINDKLMLNVKCKMINTSEGGY